MQAAVVVVVMGALDQMEQAQPEEMVGRQLLIQLQGHRKVTLGVAVVEFIAPELVELVAQMLEMVVIQQIQRPLVLQTLVAAVGPVEVEQG